MKKIAPKTIKKISKAISPPLSKVEKTKGRPIFQQETAKKAVKASEIKPAAITLILPAKEEKQKVKVVIKPAKTSV